MPGPAGPGQLSQLPRKPGRGPRALDQSQWPAVPGPLAVFASTCKQSGRVCIYMQTGQVDQVLSQGLAQVLAQLAQVDQAQLVVARSTRPAGHGPWPVLPGKCCTAATRHARMTSWRGPWALCTAAWAKDPRPRMSHGTALAWTSGPDFWPHAGASQALARFHTVNDGLKYICKNRPPLFKMRLVKKFFANF
jgi:hypothetical protein